MYVDENITLCLCEKSSGKLVLEAFDKNEKVDLAVFTKEVMKILPFADRSYKELSILTGLPRDRLKKAKLGMFVSQSDALILQICSDVFHALGSAYCGIRDRSEMHLSGYCLWLFIIDRNKIKLTLSGLIPNLIKMAQKLPKLEFECPKEFEPFVYFLQPPIKIGED